MPISSSLSPELGENGGRSSSFRSARGQREGEREGEGMRDNPGRPAKSPQGAGSVSCPSQKKDFLLLLLTAGAGLGFLSSLLCSSRCDKSFRLSNPAHLVVPAMG